MNKKYKIKNDDEFIEYIRLDQYYHRDKPIESFLHRLTINEVDIKTDAYPCYKDSLLCKCIFEGSDYIDVVHNLIFEKKVFVNYEPSQEDIEFINNVDFDEIHRKHFYYYDSTLRSPLMDILTEYDTSFLYKKSKKNKWLEIIIYLINNKVYCNKKIIPYLQNKIEVYKKRNKYGELFDKDIHYYTDILEKIKENYSFI